MTHILSKRWLAPSIFEMVVEAPRVAKKAKAGEFLVVMATEEGSASLTIADFDAKAGTVTMVVMVVGTSTHKMSKLEAGESLYAFLGPLGHASHIENHGTVVMVAGGVGAAPIYPITRAMKEAGNRVITIQGARNGELLFWDDKLEAVSDEFIVCTDDGSRGRKALVTEPLKEILEREGDAVSVVYAIGPIPMMKFSSFTTKPFGVKTIVSLNSIMIDATGMCGGCRISVASETKYTCVDGPEFDGHDVDWDVMNLRQRAYHEEEKCSYDRYVDELKGKEA